MTKNYRYIEEFRDKYKGEEIYIIASGPSLDDFPDDFFDNRIMITVNNSYLAVPITKDTYISAVHTSVLDDLQKTEPELLTYGLAFCPVDRTQDSRGNPYNQIGRYGETPIYARSCIGHHTRENFQEIARQIMNRQPAIFRTRGTSAHPPIQVAVVLGAKKVTLVGYDECCKKHQYYWQRSRRGKKNPAIELKEYSQKIIKAGFAHMTEGRIWLSQIFKSYGIEIRRYYYKDGEYYKKGFEKID